MYKYIFIFIYSYLCLCIYVDLFIYMYRNIYIYIHISIFRERERYVCMYIYIYINTCTAFAGGRWDAAALSQAAVQFGSKGLWSPFSQGWAGNARSGSCFPVSFVFRSLERFGSQSGTAAGRTWITEKYHGCRLPPLSLERSLTAS